MASFHELGCCRRRVISSESEHLESPVEKALGVWGGETLSQEFQIRCQPGKGGRSPMGNWGGREDAQETWPNRSVLKVGYLGGWARRKHLLPPERESVSLLKRWSNGLSHRGCHPGLVSLQNLYLFPIQCLHISPGDRGEGGEVV